MDLTKTKDPKRSIQWQGKSLVNCSRKELIDCIIELMKQLAITNTMKSSEVENDKVIRNS
jgi:hypothetical protein